jgi:putative nucleotidyltransferase with HDIG domain
MSHTVRSLGWGAIPYIAIIVSGVAIMARSVTDLVTHPVALEWLILVGLTIASGWATLRIPAIPISFSISDTFSIAASLLFGPAAGAITAALDGLVLSFRMLSSRRSIDRVIFNMAAPAIAIWVAAQVFFAVEGSQPSLDGVVAALRLLAALLLFGALMFGLNSGLVAAVVSFEQGGSMLSIWREFLARVWITYLGGIFGATMVLLLARFSTLETLILIIPMPVILYVSFRHAIGRAEDRIKHLGNVNRVYVGAIEALAHAVDAKDQVTHDHTRRVQDQTIRLAQALRVEDAGEIQAIKAAALLHDVGKLAIPEHILNKPGRLTPAEYDIMKRHASIGADILSVVGFPYDVAPIVRHHHENWDGTGYPDGLAGDRIPIGSRILAVVDCFDALTSDRPYRPRMEERDALQVLRERRGNMYDPRVVDAFFNLHAEATASAPTARPPAAPIAASSFSEPLVSRADETRDDVDLQMFFTLGRSLSLLPGSTTIRQLGDILWNTFRTRLPATVLVLYGYDESADAITVVYKAGAAASEIDAHPIPLGDRLSGWVAATGQAVVNSDARLDLDEAARARATLRSALAVPFIANGRIGGVLSFYATTSNAFDDTHRRLIETASRLVAGTLPDLLRFRTAPQSTEQQSRNDTSVLQTTKSG